MSFVGIISMTESGRVITSLYKDKDHHYYIVDLVPGTGFTQYYAYQVPRRKIEEYINTHETKCLNPMHRTIYKVHHFDFSILGTETTKNALLFSTHSEEYECVDEQKILSEFQTVD